MGWMTVVTGLLAATVVILMMNLVRSEERIEREMPHRCSIRDPQFRREMSVLLGPSILAGNRVTEFHNGDEIFPAMLEAIGSARRTITLESYIYWSGDVGRAFTTALSERATGGVRVHVTLDWAGSMKMDDQMLDQMRRSGVQVIQYRPLRWYNLVRLNNRTHRKLLVIDGTIGFTGGVGIADQWSGRAQDPEHWRDSHFKIEGPVVAQLQGAFNENWTKATGRLLNGPEYFPAIEATGDMEAHLIVASPAGGSESMYLMYLFAIAGAQESIDLSASYFIPDDLILGAMVSARHRGVAVRILVPGKHLDSLTVKLASKANWGRLLQAGAEIHEYGPTMIHVKSLVIDRELVSVGSTNFDMRSFLLNDEASLNVYDRPFAEHMTELFERDLLSASPYTYAQWARRPLGERFAERMLWPIRSQL